jgi:hypothetical protein
MYLHPHLRDALTRQSQRDLTDAAERSRLVALGRMRDDPRPPLRRRRWVDAGREVMIRPATAGDRAALGRLAALDDAPRLTGDVLVVEVEGELWAACSLADGRTIGDPFRPSQAARALLELRREQIAAAERGDSRSSRRHGLLRQLRLGS